MNKSESKIRAAIEAHEAKVKALKKQERTLLRRRLAEEQRQRDKNNQLLGAAIARIANVTALNKLRGHVCARKSDFIHVVRGDVDESSYQKLLAYIDEIAAHKQAEPNALESQKS